MTSPDATLDYIDFLRQRGSISHIVKASESTTLSTLALTQRCLASGITFPVPLPDGSVGVNVPGDIPPALGALDVVIEAVAKVPDDQEGPLPETMVSDAQGMPIVHPDELETADHAPTHSDAEEGERSEAGEQAVTDDPDAHIDEQDIWGEASEASTEIFETNTGASENDTGDHDFESSDGLAHNAPQNSDDDCKYSDGLHANEREPVPEWVQTQLDMTSEIAVRMDALAADHVTLVERIESFAGLLEEVATRPVPRPDATEFNLGMARMTAAFANGIRRIDAALEALEARSNGPDTGAALASGLSAIADAVRKEKVALEGGGVAGSPDLTVIASMQETISHQLAKLIEAHQVAQPLELKEFLLDLRHATAELLAEQARLAKTG